MRRPLAVALTGGIAAGKKVYIAYANNQGTFKNGIDGLARAHAIEHCDRIVDPTNREQCHAARMLERGHVGA